VGIRAAPGRRPRTWNGVAPGFSRRRSLGGIGFYIRAFQYDKVATLTVVVLAMVIAIEQLSVWIRRRLR
jgi:hypothetical protein